jgi:hypothetical protein
MKWRIILIPPMALFEVLCFIVCCMLLVVHRPTALRLSNWVVENLPSKEWYFHKEKK